MSDEPIPKVDDKFWFEYSESLITKAQENRDSAANKLQELALWLWGIYTSSAAVGLLLSSRTFSAEEKLFVAATSGALIAVYWSTVWTQMPLVVAFDPRSPTDISDAYSHALSVKTRRLHFSLFLSVVAALMVASSLVLASSAKEESAITPGLTAEIVPLPEGKFSLVATAQVERVALATLCIRPLRDSSAPSCKDYKPTDAGTIQVNIPLETGIKCLEISVSWRGESKTKVQLSRTLEVRPPKK